MNKMTKALAVGASLLVCAGAAQAAVHEVNLTGASAQFNFWNDASKTFLEQQYGCTGVVQGITFDGKKGYAKSTSCTGGDTYILRYTSNASYDGITALKGTQDVDSCNGGAGTIKRKYANDGNPLKADGKTIDTVDALGNPSPDAVCLDTQIGASDVAASSFSQVSKGLKIGPMGNPAAGNGGITASDNVYGPTGTATTGTLTVTSADATGLTTNANHLAVPFAAYVNQGVTWKKCGTAGSTTAQRNANNFCQADSDCNTAGGETCQSTTIDNLSRQQLVLLFSGTVTNWRDFGGYFDQKPVVLCLRHAGSGTHATIDNAVMKGSWGKALTSIQKNNYAANGNQQTYNNYAAGANTATNSNFIWFNNGTADVKNCLDGKIHDTIANADLAGRGDIGAVGYMDADVPGAAHYVQIKYNGVVASRQAVRNGWYDWFTMQNMYVNPADANYANYSAIYNNLITFVQNPANIPNGTGFTLANESAFWSTKGEMRVTKSSDTAYPATKAVPTSPQTP